MKLYRFSDPRSWKRFERDFEKANATSDVAEQVTAILDDIRIRGATALREYTLTFDGVKLAPGRFRVPPERLREAAHGLEPGQRRALRESMAQVKAFHRRTLPGDWLEKNAHGARYGERYYPIRRAGIYIPGGQVPLISTVVMTVVPARVARVPEIAVFTPPSALQAGGEPHPALLGALHLCGVREVYMLGGVQAVAAAAFGAPGIPAVDKIFGPGNAYVNEAKRQVFGRVGVDLQPGPSEVMVIADDGANPEHVAADLLAQAEHGTGKEKVFLVTFSPEMVEAVEAAIDAQLPQLSHRKAIRRVLDRHGFAIIAEDREAAAAIANRVAPEHLELQVAAADLAYLTRRITTAGAILQGYWTPTVLGDFVAGPSHTLPTGGTGRFFSGLRSMDFLRRTSVIRYSERSARAAAPAVRLFSAMEQLDAHGKSLDIRLETAADPKSRPSTKGNRR